MRRSGTLPDPSPIEPGDHLCWIHPSDQERRRVLGAVVAAGFAAGQRVLCLPRAGDEPEFLDGLADTGLDVERRIASGDLVVSAAEEAYGAGGPFDPAALARRFAELVDRALADGFAGLRVYADNGWLLRDAVVLEQWARYELLADLLIERSPLVGVCGFAAGDLDDDARALVASVHPLVLGAETRESFRVHGDGAGGVAVGGDIDYFCLDSLRSLLEAALDEVELAVIDLSAVKVADAAATGAVADVAAACAARRGSLLLKGAPPSLLRMWDLLGFDALEGVVIEAAAA